MKNGSNGSAYVIGVGMTKFEKPGAKEWDYPDMAREAGKKALADAGVAYDEVEQAYAGYVYGESTSGQRAVYELGHHRHPGLQRQQQLLDRLDARCTWRARRSRAASPTACSRSASRRWSRARSARSSPTASSRWTSHVGALAELLRGRTAPPRAADVRRRRPRAHGEVRLRARALRQDRREEPPALGEQPVRAVPGRVHARGDPRRADDLRAADQAAVLADLRRRGRGDPRSASASSTQHGLRPRGRDRRPGDDHRLRVARFDGPHAPAWSATT